MKFGKTYRKGVHIYKMKPFYTETLKIGFDILRAYIDVSP